MELVKESEGVQEQQKKAINAETSLIFFFFFICFRASRNETGNTRRTKSNFFENRGSWGGGSSSLLANQWTWPVSMDSAHPCPTAQAARRQPPQLPCSPRDAASPSARSARHPLPAPLAVAWFPIDLPIVPPSTNLVSLHVFFYSVFPFTSSCVYPYILIVTWKK